MQLLRGSFSLLVLYDVADEIKLDRLRELKRTEPARREPSFKHPAPEYVRFERPPVVEYLDPVLISPGEEFQVRIKYFDYGVVSVELELPFEARWEDLVRLSSRFISAPEIERRAMDLIRGRLAQVATALVQPYENWLSEDYYIINVREALDADGVALPAASFLKNHGDEIARVVRGESGPLAEAESADALSSSLSYYPTDLLVVGWVAAFVYDTPEGAAPTIQLLEYANTQLLQFRHYDEVLSRMLDNVYEAVKGGGGPFRHWRLTKRAAQLNTVRLEVTDLAERTDNAIKFISDMFYARAYRMAATRVGVTDYRTLVERKLKIAADLYQSMVDDYHAARSFLLELMVVMILVIELIHLFRGYF